MNMTLQAVYFCATSGQRWGKGYTPQEAKENAGLKNKAAEKNCQWYVQAAVFNNPEPAELNNLYSCITADNFNGSPKYYDQDRTEEDNKMINDKHVGWLMIEKHMDD